MKSEINYGLEIENEKLRSFCMDITELQKEFLNKEGVSQRYKSLGSLLLEISKFDRNYLMDYGWAVENTRNVLERIETSISIIRGLISDISTQIEISKHSFFGFLNLSGLRENRDNWAAVLSKFQVALTLMNYVKK